MILEDEEAEEARLVAELLANIKGMGIVRAKTLRGVYDLVRQECKADSLSDGLVAIALSHAKRVPCFSLDRDEWVLL
jgi:hypothetical protein